MSGSLQDQLLKVGLVTEEQLRNARERPKPENDKRKKPPKNKRNAKHTKAKRRLKDKPKAAPNDADKANQQSPAKRGNNVPPVKKIPGDVLSPEERALRNRVHAMITEAIIERENAEFPYHFVKGSRIKRIYVTQEQRDRLAKDELAVAAMKGRHYLIPMSVAHDVKALIPQYFIAMGNSQELTEGTQVDDSQDDEYADYQVPDDLMW